MSSCSTRSTGTASIDCSTRTVDLSSIPVSTRSMVNASTTCPTCVVPPSGRLVVEGCPAIDANGEYELDTIGTQAGKPRFVKPSNWFRGVYVAYREKPEPMWVMTYDPVDGPQSAKSTFAKSPASAHMDLPPNGKDVQWMVVQPNTGWQTKENMQVTLSMMEHLQAEKPILTHTVSTKPNMLRGLDEEIELLLKEIFDSIDKAKKGKLSKADLMNSALVQRELPFLVEHLAVVEAEDKSITYEMFKDFVMREAAGLMKIRVIRDKFNKFARSNGSRRQQALVIKREQVPQLIETEFPSLGLDVCQIQNALTQRSPQNAASEFDCDEFVECITDLMEYLQYRLAQIVGLDTLKHRLTAFCQGAILDKRRAEVADRDGRHFFPTKARHMIFRGNSGTGKTTLAKLVGDVLLKAGLVQTNAFVYVQREDLVASVVGKTAQQTKQKVKEAKGGILFIDEAYRLFPKDADAKDFGREAIDELMAAMLVEDGPVMIFAGYPKLMDSFIQSNPGLCSRIPNSFNFEDFSWMQLVLVLDQIVEKTGFRWAETVRLQQVAEVLRRKTPPGAAESMNGRMCELIFMFAKQMLDKRLLDVPGDYDSDKLFEINLSDICDGCCMVPRPADPRIAYLKSEEDDAELEDLQSTESWLNTKLDKLTGLSEFKDQMKLLQRGIALDQERARQGRKVAMSSLNHMVFAGNPGTGKTIVARIMAEFLQRCGVIKTRKLVEVQREAFIGRGTLGSTEAAIAAVIESAKDGVLFLDDANRLCDDDAGKQAIQALMTHMLAPDAPVMIFASSMQGVTNFLETNPGLASRIPYRFAFPDHSSSALARILHSNVLKMGLSLGPEVSTEDISAIFEGCPEKARMHTNGHMCQLAAKFAKDALDSSCTELNEVSWQLGLDHMRMGIERAAGVQLGCSWATKMVLPPPSKPLMRSARHKSLLGA